MYARVRAAIGQKIDKAKDFTLSAVTWTSTGGRAVYTTRVNFIDRAVEILAVKDISEDTATLGEKVACATCSPSSKFTHGPNREMPLRSQRVEGSSP